MYIVKGDNRTILFTLIMFCVFITQNGVLGNLPVLLLILPTLFFASKIIIYKNNELVNIYN